MTTTSDTTCSAWDETSVLTETLHTAIAEEPKPSPRGAAEALQSAVVQPTREFKFQWNGKLCKGSGFHERVIKGNVDEVKEWLKRAPHDAHSVFTYETGGKGSGTGQAIHIAASRGKLEIVKSLLNSEASIDAGVFYKGTKHYDVLHAAVFSEGRGSAYDVVHHLAELHQEQHILFSTNSFGDPILRIAWRTGNEEMIKLCSDLDGKQLKTFPNRRVAPRDLQPMSRMESNQES